MKELIPLLAFLLICFSCQNASEGELRLIPDAETIERVRTKNLDYSYAVFKNQFGDPLTEEDRSLLNQGKLAKDYYEDKQGIIREVRVRPLLLKDKFTEIQRRTLSINPLDDFTILPIDCSALDSLYSEVELADQRVRSEGGDMQQVDKRNQQLVISALSSCGWTEEHLFTIWLVFQHAPSEIMTYYYPQLKLYSMEGKIRRSTLALMEDRLLMNNGYKQIYGSQIRDGHLYDLEDPDSVNKWRAEVGLGPIEEYISRWDLSFEEEKERLSSYSK